MNGIHLRPVEDAVGQPTLQIPEAGSMFEVADGGVARDTLKLRIVHHEFESQRASGYRPLTLMRSRFQPNQSARREPHGGSHAISSDRRQHGRD
jgi:hypothetical protein